MKSFNVSTAIVLMLVLGSCWPFLRLLAAAQGIAASDALVVQVPGKTIQVLRSDWKPMNNEFEWAANFEQLKRESRQEFARVVTVFKLPMSNDRRLGTKLSPNEYLELFAVHAGTVTVQVRVDKGSYWVLSRDTYRVPSNPEEEFYDRQLREIISDRVITDEEFRWVHIQLQSHIDSSRYLLQTTF
jgi:hypothetical protein